MHHVTLDSWSRIASPIHRLDPRAKIAAALAIIVSLVVGQRSYGWLFVSYLALLAALILAARVPLTLLAARAALVLPFAGTLAVVNWFHGDASRAAAVLGKSYISALAVLFLLATTPLHALLRGLELLRVPRFFLMVAQFVYRYLFVLSEQAQHMLQARRCRAPRGTRQPLASAAAGAIGVLFARSYARAERIHQAMLARGFQGHFVLLDQPSLRAADWLFVSGILGAIAALHLFLWNR